MIGGGTVPLRIDTDRIQQISDMKSMEPALVEKLVEIGMRSFGSKMTAKEVKEHIAVNDILFVVRDGEGKPIGFSGSTYPNVVYLAAAAVDPDSQGRGTYKKLTKERIVKGLASGCNIIMTSTQNPRVEAGITRVLNNMRDEGLITGYLTSRMLNKGKYGRMLTDEVPKSDTEELKLVYADLDYEKGDAYELIFIVQKAKGGTHDN